MRKNVPRDMQGVTGLAPPFCTSLLGGGQELVLLSRNQGGLHGSGRRGGLKADEFSDSKGERWAVGAVRQRESHERAQGSEAENDSDLLGREAALGGRKGLGALGERAVKWRRGRSSRPGEPGREGACVERAEAEDGHGEAHSLHARRRVSDTLAASWEMGRPGADRLGDLTEVSWASRGHGQNGDWAVGLSRLW